MACMLLISHENREIVIHRLDYLQVSAEAALARNRIHKDPTSKVVETTYCMVHTPCLLVVVARFFRRRLLRDATNQLRSFVEHSLAGVICAAAKNNE